MQARVELRDATIRFTPPQRHAHAAEANAAEQRYARQSGFLPN
jgi:hypothetical protein